MHVLSEVSLHDKAAVFVLSVTSCQNSAPPLEILSVAMIADKGHSLCLLSCLPNLSQDIKIPPDKEYCSESIQFNIISLHWQNSEYLKN